jgi:putative ABC transport system substrate-binding protein
VIGRRRWLASALAGAAGLAVGAPGRPTSRKQVGWLSLGSPWSIGPFRERMRELGWREGEDYAIEARWAYSDQSRLPRLADELVARGVDVVVTQSTPAAMAMRHATTAIPIVMAGVNAPIHMGIVETLERPGGNATGIAHTPPGLSTKRLQMLLELAPRVRRVAVLDQDDSASEGLRVAAAFNRSEIFVAVAKSTFDVAAMLESLRIGGVDALFVAPVPVIEAAYTVIADFARRHAWPSMGGASSFPVAGGLMSYWADWGEIRRQAAEYVDKILRGATPGELPIGLPMRYQLVLNLATARAIGIEFPRSLRLRADEIIA